MSKQENALKLADIENSLHNDSLVSQHRDIADWQASLQSACFSAITESDIEQIVKNQVVKAKEGDQAAIKFIFGHIVGGNRPVSIKQTLVVTDVETAARMAYRAS